MIDHFIYSATSAPGPVNITSKVQTSITGAFVSWSPPDDDGGCPITSYLVYIDSQNVSETSFTNYSTNDLTCSESRNYNLSVIAMNGAGQGTRQDVNLNLVARRE